MNRQPLQWIPRFFRTTRRGITDALPGDPSVFRAFASIAKRQGDKVALRYQGTTVGYTELLREAEKVAARLPAPDAESPGRVALFFHDRIRAVTAILGTLRAGHAFVVLDPGDPAERIQYILEDCAPLALLTDTENYFQVDGLVPKGCVRINVQEPAKNAQPPPPLPARGDRTAYICYTSGSTGKPKGVCQTGGNLLYFVHHYSAALGIRPDDRLSLLYSLGFSAANMDIFGGLLNGATVCAYDMRREGIPGLAGWLDHEAVTVLHAVPTVFRKLAAALPEGRILPHIRAIDLGGETVTPQDVALWRDHFPPHSTCWNHLAATEASVIAQYPLERSMAGRTGLLPAGKSPAGLEVRVVGEDGSPAPADAPGRLVITSPHTSPGYWQRPELNRVHFAEDPMRPGWRMFRSEDTGYLGPDGLLYFQGRLGTRVKIRGLTVDLAEVESALKDCPGVRDAAAVALSGQDGGQTECLTAHVVVESPEKENAAHLRRELAGRLPGYMIPSAFGFHRALPQTPSGKLDRATLKDFPVAATAAVHNPPATEWEKKVADVFSEILGGEPAGRTGDFFLLGGDSMSAVHLLNALGGLSGRDFPLALLLENSTVSGLAAALEKQAVSAAATKGSPLLVPLQTRGRHPLLFLTHGRLGQAHASPHFIQLLGTEQPVFAIQARGLDGKDKPNISIDDMARDYIGAIRTVQERGPYFIGGLCAGSYITMRMAALLRQSGEEVLPLLLLDPPPPPFRKPKDLVPGSRGEKVLEYSIDQRLHQRQHQGNIRADLRSPEHRQAAIDVVMAFERALSTHVPEPYPYPVYMLASKLRTAPDKWGSPEIRKACFSGELNIFEVAGRHEEIFNVHNPDFARHLTLCLETIREAARSPGTGKGAGS